MRRLSLALLALAIFVPVFSGASHPGHGRAAGDVAVQAAGPYRLHIPIVTRREDPPPPPAPAASPIVAMTLPSAAVTTGSPVEERDTELLGGVEYFQQPSSPDRIAWYSGFGRPGYGGSNSILSAHVNYFGYGAATPFANLEDTQVGDTLTLYLQNGRTYAFTIISAQVIPLASLDMDAVVYPPLPPNKERVTLITCDGDAILIPGGGGRVEYNSRLIVVAERTIN